MAKSHLVSKLTSSLNSMREYEPRKKSVSWIHGTRLSYGRESMSSYEILEMPVEVVLMAKEKSIPIQVLGMMLCGGDSRR